jgi:hypothetical protein
MEVVLMVDKVKENYLRRQAKRLNLLLKKSKAKKFKINDKGGYAIIEPSGNDILAGELFDLTIDDVAEYLDQYEEKLIKEG